MGVTDPARVQSVLPIEDHVVPANRADVRQQGGLNTLFHRVPVAQHRINLPDLPVDDRRQDEHQTAGPAHLLLPIAALCLPPFAIVDMPRYAMELFAFQQSSPDPAAEGRESREMLGIM